MQEQKKKGLRWKIFKLFGPPQVQTLVNYLDELTADGSGIAIFPTGDFEFHVKTSDDQDLEPLVFPTAIQRQAFQQGMNFGIGMMGGSTSPLSKDEFDMIDIMEKKSTHGGGGGKLN
jgi:hypothetical protein